MHKVSPHSQLPVRNDEYYNFKPNTYDGEFFQEDGLQGRFEIDLTNAIGMDADCEIVDDDDTRDEVKNSKDIQMVDQLRLGNGNEDNTPPSDNVDYVNMVDSDDET